MQGKAINCIKPEHIIRKDIFRIISLFLWDLQEYERGFMHAETGQLFSKSTTWPIKGKLFLQTFFFFFLIAALITWSIFIFYFV